MGGVSPNIFYLHRNGMMSFSVVNILLHGFSKFIYLSVKKTRNKNGMLKYVNSRDTTEALVALKMLVR